MSVHGSRAACIGIMNWGALHGKEKLVPRYEDGQPMDVNNQVYQVSRSLLHVFGETLLFPQTYVAVKITILCVLLV